MQIAYNVRIFIRIFSAMINRRNLLLSLAVWGLLSPTVSSARTNKSLRIIVPYPAGGPLDATARVVAEMLQPLRGKVIVENRPGAAGARGLLALKESEPDGQTLAMGAVATLAVNPWIRDNLPYQPNDFAGVCLLSDVPNVLVMTPQTMQKLGVKTLQELLDYIRQNPGKLNAASGGNGSAGHIIGEVLSNQGYRTEHIAFAGAAAAQLSVLAGETDLMFDNWASAKAAVSDGRLVALAQTVSDPDNSVPAPSLSSLGIDCDISTWFGLIAPSATPDAIRRGIFNDIEKALLESENQQKFLLASGSTAILDPKAFDIWIAGEQKKYQMLLRALKLTS